MREKEKKGDRLMSGLREGGLVRVSGRPDKVYRVYGLWPRGRVKVREVRIVKYGEFADWFPAHPVSDREFPASMVSDFEVDDYGWPVEKEEVI